MKKLLLLTYCLLSCLFVCADEEFVFSRLSVINGLPDNNIRYMEQDKTGCLLLLSPYAAYSYDGYSYRKLPQQSYDYLLRKSQQRPKNSDGSFYDNLGNKVTVSEDGYITWHDRKSQETVRMKVFDKQTQTLSTNLKLNVISTADGHLWTSVNGNGVFCYHRKTKKMRHFSVNTDKDIIGNDFVVAMMEDRAGNIWFSAEHYGLTCILAKERNYEVLDINGIEDNRNNVRMIHRLSNGNIIIAGNNGELFLSKDELKTLIAMPNLGETYISACLDGQQRLWLGSRKKGVRINDKWYSDGRIDCIIRDKQDRIWMCGIHKPLMLATLSTQGKYSERTFFTSQDLQPRVIMLDHTGKIWLGTAKGLFVFDPDELIANPWKYRKVSDLSIRVLYEDSQQQLWIGTEGGGVYMGALQADISKYQHFSTNNRFNNDVVQLIAEDAQHHICIGTEAGATYLDMKGNYIRTLFFLEPLARNFFNERSSVLLRDGRMAFATMEGIVIAQKELVSQQVPELSPSITDLLINGVSIYDLQEDKSIKGFITDTSTIDLSYEQNSLTFAFSAFSYNGYQPTLYSCRLEGYDDNWSAASTINTASYKNLKTGTYKFHLRYKLADGDWKEVTKSLQVVIHPPFWLTKTALFLYVIFAILLVWIIFRHLRSIYRLRQQIVLEKKLTEFKLRFFTNISHEFRTPLTLIQVAVDHLVEAKDVPTELRQPITSAQRNVGRMQRLINQLLEFRKMQEGKLSLSLQETEIVSFLYNIFVDFHETASGKQINFQFIPQQKQMTLYLDRGFVSKIVYNLLSNAFKYTPSKGNVSMKVRQQDQELMIVVTDTGIGIEKDKQAQLFERYANNQIAADSMGIGLNLTRELIRIHHGSIRYEENPDGGSIFTVIFPTDTTVYNEKDFLKVDTGIDNGETVIKRKNMQIDHPLLMAEPMNDKRILVVEDDIDISNMLRQELGRYFTIDTASDGLEAWEKLNEQENSYDLIISDVLMPRMNGYHLLENIRKTSTLRTLPVILLTALADNSKHAKGLETGADAYISKPFDRNILIAQVANLLRQRDMLYADFAKGPKPATELKEVIRDEKDKKFLAQLDAIIMKHLCDETLDVNQLATIFSIGRTNFYAKVKNLTGLSPNAYINQCRMNKAATLLYEGSLSVSEVSYQVGFSNPKYFATQFKKMFGMTPSAYQRGK